MLRKYVNANSNSLDEMSHDQFDRYLEQEGILDMINLISTLQSDRMNNQRAELRPLQPDDTKGASLPGQNASATLSIKPEEDFLEIIARVQGSRIEDQRTELPRLEPAHAPGEIDTQKSEATQNRSGQQEPEKPVVVEAGLQEPVSGQSQVIVAPVEPPTPALGRAARDDAEQDAFFAQLMRAQSSRLEDQRATIGGGSKKN